MSRDEEVDQKRRRTQAIYKPAKHVGGKEVGESNSNKQGLHDGDMSWMRTREVSAWGTEDIRDWPLLSGLRIGVNCDVLEQQGRVITCLDAHYIDCLHAYGAEVFLLAAGAQGGKLPAMLEHVDGLLLIGGGDLDPRRDGFHRHESQTLMHPRREKFDRQLVQLAKKNRLPVLGIGAGMQTINQVCGGTLFYHLPEDKPKLPPHYHPTERDHGHMIYCHPRSLVKQVYPEICADVRSQHHMAVDDVATGFTPTAWAAGGIIEAIESTREDWLAIGVQWHPEHVAAHELDPILFELWLRGVGRVKSRVER